MMFKPVNSPKSTLERVRPQTRFLHHYIAAFWQGRPSYPSPEMNQVIQRANRALGELIKMCTRSTDEDPMSRMGIALPENQRLLADEMVHQIALTMLKAPFTAPSWNSNQSPNINLADVNDHKEVHAVCCLAYRLLKQMVLSNPSFACRLAPAIPFMLTQMGSRFRVSDTLREIFIDNADLINKVTGDVLQGYVRHAEANKNQLRYAKFLGGVCVCKGSNVLRIQDTVCQIVLDNSPHLLVNMKLDNESVVWVQLTSPVGVKDLVSKDSKKGGGGGELSKEKKEELNIPPEGFKKGDWMQLSLYCRQGPHAVVGNLETLLQLYARVAESNAKTKAVVQKFVPPQLLQAVLGTKSKHRDLPDKWKAAFYDIVTVLCADASPPLVMCWSKLDEGHNQAETLPLAYQDIVQEALTFMAANVVQTASNRERNKLIQSVLLMFQRMASAALLTDHQLRTLVPVLMKMDGSSDMMGKLQKEGTEAWNKYEGNDYNQPIMQCKRQVCAVLNAIIDCEIRRTVHSMLREFKANLHEPDMTEIVLCILRKRSMERELPGLTLLNAKSLINMLLSFTLYDMNELVGDSLSLLVRYHSFQSEVCRQLQDVVVFQEPFNQVQDCVLSFSRMVSHYDTLETLSEAEVESAVELMYELSHWLMLPISGIDQHLSFDSEPPIQLSVQHQNFMRKSGLHTLLAQLSRQHQNPTLISSVSRLLKLFCTNNKRNQEVAFSSMGQMLDWMSVTEHGDCIVEIFRNNYSLCTQLTQGLVEKAIATIANEHTDLEVCINNIKFLEQLVVVNGIPIARNQTLVMHALTGSQYSLLEQLSTISGKMSPAVVQRAAAVVELMYLCTQGINPTTESLARGLIPLSKILHVLSESEDPIPLPYQLPYLHLLIEVFFLAEDKESKWWPESDEFWSVLERFTIVLNQCKKKLELGEAADTYGIVEFICGGVLPLMVYVLKPEIQLSKQYPMIQQMVNAFLEMADILPALPKKYMDSIHRFLTAAQLHVKPGGLDISKEKVTTQLRKSQSIDEVKPKPEALLDAKLQELQRASESHCKLGVDNEAKFAEELRPFLLPQFTSSKHKKESARYESVVAKIFKQLQQFALKDKVAVSLLLAFCDMITKHKDDEHVLLALQNWFNLHKSADVIPLLIQEGNPIVVPSVVKFGIALLHGGNTSVQCDLIKWFRNVDEYFFEYVISRIQKGGQLLRQWRQEKTFIKQLFENSNQYNLTTEQMNMHQVLMDPHKDLSEVSQLMRLLQLFCEGHHLEFQNYVRFQHDNWRTLNTVTEVVGFMRELVNFEMMDNEILETCVQACKTLTEFCQGPCVENQRALMLANVCTDINVVFRSPYNGCDPEKVDDLRNEATATLLSLLEATHDATLPCLMVKELSLEGISDALSRMVQRYNETYQQFSDEEKEDKARNTFNLFILIYVLHQWTGNTDLKEVLDKTKGIETFHKMLGCIEIARDGVVEKVFFCRPTISAMLSPEKRNTLLTEVNRESAAAKLADFFEKANDLITEMEFAQEAKSAIEDFWPSILHKFIVELITGRGASFLNTSYLFNALVINIIMILSEQHHYQILLIGRVILGISQLLISFVLVLYMTTFELPLTVKRVRRKDNNYVLPKKGEFFPPKIPLKALWSLPRAEKTKYIYYPWSLLLSILGLAVSPYFFAFQLLGIVRQSTVLQSVMTAVTSNGRSLALTALLAVVVIYLFTVAGYLFFREDFSIKGEPLCNNFLQCFVWTLSNGLREGAGIGAAMSTPSWNSPHIGFRITYDLMFFACVNIGLINMVFGIIIDAFAELRDKRQSQEEDQRSRCFICGHEADTFNRLEQDGFEKHTKRAHNMWDYLHFLHYLKRKPADEYTGQESYVHQMTLRTDMGFFPLGKATELQQTEQEEEKAINEDSSKITRIDERLRALESTIDRIDRLLSSLHGQGDGDA
eukprot:NODE_3_length_6384_cov_15.471011_g2_i0.p1 GENE.NODE_3_length_6384_cov_15.471011_g2_i0~~NODE_3_length_6384_cov_15.471011_g2_i0.p1  ORF type:complete len:2102 (+),score=358.02 NODE_3_length_6384_cov_15.471011_g2_i0:517-6306(+)